MGGVGRPVAMTPIEHTQVFSGPTPHPEIMERYDALVPGSAERLFLLAEAESAHRREIEAKVSDANIEAQQRQLSIAEYQGRATFRSDLVGQSAGLIVSLVCVSGAVFLATSGQPGVAVALAAIPTAAVIQAFFAKRTPPSK